MVKNPAAMQETWAWSLGWEDPLEKETATLSSILAWRIPWTEEPGRLLSMGLQRVGHGLCITINYDSKEIMSSQRVLKSYFNCKAPWSSIHSRSQHLRMCVCAHLLSSIWLFCDLKDYSPWSSSIHGIPQARILEWVAISSSRGSSQPKNRAWLSYISCFGRQTVYHWATQEALSTFTEAYLLGSALLHEGSAPKWERERERINCQTSSITTTGVCMNCPAGPPPLLCPTSLCPLFASGNTSLKLASRKLNFCC